MPCRVSDDADVDMCVCVCVCHTHCELVHSLCSCVCLLKVCPSSSHHPVSGWFPCLLHQEREERLTQHPQTEYRTSSLHHTNPTIPHCTHTDTRPRSDAVFKGAVSDFSKCS